MFLIFQRIYWSTIMVIDNRAFSIYGHIFCTYVRTRAWGNIVDLCQWNDQDPLVTVIRVSKEVIVSFMITSKLKNR